MIAASTLALISASGFTFATAGPVLRNCTQANLWSPATSEWHLNATCWDNVHVLTCSQIELDLCFADIDGQLEPSANGEGIRNCQDCSLQESDLCCQCEGNDGKYQDSCTDLGETMTVSDDGLLSCWGWIADQC
ncbi:hypothetical protein PG984_007217 [Apiospora sp. TS-2023a]